MESNVRNVMESSCLGKCSSEKSAKQHEKQKRKPRQGSNMFRIRSARKDEVIRAIFGEYEESRSRLCKLLNADKSQRHCTYFSEREQTDLSCERNYGEWTGETESMYVRETATV